MRILKKFFEDRKTFQSKLLKYFDELGLIIHHDYIDTTNIIILYEKFTILYDFEEYEDEYHRLFVEFGTNDGFFIKIYEYDDLIHHINKISEIKNKLRILKINRLL